MRARSGQQRSIHVLFFINVRQHSVLGQGWRIYMGQCVSRKAGAVVAASGHHNSPSYRIMEKHAQKQVSFSLWIFFSTSSLFFFFFPRSLHVENPPRATRAIDSLTPRETAKTPLFQVAPIDPVELGGSFAHGSTTVSQVPLYVFTRVAFTQLCP